MTWGEIDDEAIAAAAGLIGVPLRRDRMQWVRDASRDAIRHFAWGIGDANPLWLDAHYAATTRWKGVLAPPCFLYAADYTVVAPKLPGVQWIYAGTEWTWLDAIRVDDEFAVTAVLTGQREMSGRRFPRWVLQDGEISYRRTDGSALAVAVGHCARTPRGSAGHREPGGAQEEGRRYSTQQLTEIEAMGLAESPRGGRTLWWEDLVTGASIPPVVKGPLSVVDIVAWYAATQGAQPYGGVHADALRYRRRHADYHLNEETGAQDSAGRGHLEERTGRDVGMGGVYDVGPQRIAWAGQMLANWHGDDGFLHRLDVEVRRPNLVGDTTWWNGEVTALWRDEEGSFASVRVWATNQQDVRTAWGSAVVALPSRERGAVALPLTRAHNEPVGSTR